MTSHPNTHLGTVVVKHCGVNDVYTGFNASPIALFASLLAYAFDYRPTKPSSDPKQGSGSPLHQGGKSPDSGVHPSVTDLFCELREGRYEDAVATLVDQLHRLQTSAGAETGCLQSPSVAWRCRMLRSMGGLAQAMLLLQSVEDWNAACRDRLDGGNPKGVRTRTSLTVSLVAGVVAVAVTCSDSHGGCSDTPPTGMSFGVPPRSMCSHPKEIGASPNGECSHSVETSPENLS